MFFCVVFCKNIAKYLEGIVFVKKCKFYQIIWFTLNLDESHFTQLTCRFSRADMDALVVILEFVFTVGTAALDNHGFERGIQCRVC